MESNIKTILTELKLSIKTYDIDIAGHVNNVAYIRWFEDLRIKLFIKYFNFAELLSQNLYPVVVFTEVNYKKILKLFDKPTGSMYLQSFDHGIITFIAAIKLKEKIVAVGKQKCILLDLEKSVIINGKKLQNILNLNTRIKSR